jgi:hypothetical protein
MALHKFVGCVAKRLFLHTAEDTGKGPGRAGCCMHGIKGKPHHTNTGILRASNVDAGLRIYQRLAD